MSRKETACESEHVLIKVWGYTDWKYRDKGKVCSRNWGAKEYA